MRIGTEHRPAVQCRAASAFIATRRGVAPTAAPLLDRRPSAVAQRTLQLLINGSERVAGTARLQAIASSRPPIQRMPEATARRVRVSLNTWYHVGAAPVTTPEAAVVLTQQRRATGWAGRNHVVYDFNQANVEAALYDRLLNDQYQTTPDGQLLVQLPDVNYYVVNANDTVQLGGGQCGMLVNPFTMNAFHMVFP